VFHPPPPLPSSKAWEMESLLSLQSFHARWEDDCRLNKLIIKVTLSFTPYLLCFHPLSPLFSGYPQSKNFLLNLSMKCWNSAFNAQRFESNYSSCTGRSSVKIYVAAVEALRKRERGDETQFTTKIGWEKLVCFGSQFLPFLKFHSQLSVLIPYYAETAWSRPLIAWRYG
jgi:hypothetical protein